MTWLFCWVYLITPEYKEDVLVFLVYHHSYSARLGCLVILVYFSINKYFVRNIYIYIFIFWKRRIVLEKNVLGKNIYVQPINWSVNGVHNSATWRKIEEPLSCVHGCVNGQIAIAVTRLYSRMIRGARLPRPLCYQEPDWDPVSGLGLAQ